MTEYYINDILDDLASAIIAAPDRGAQLRTLRVNPYVYDVVAEAKKSEVTRGNPLLLLGMELNRAEGVAPAHPMAS